MQPLEREVCVEDVVPFSGGGEVGPRGLGSVLLSPECMIGINGFVLLAPLFWAPSFSVSAFKGPTFLWWELPPMQVRSANSLISHL